jgi:hypothetical protein
VVSKSINPAKDFCSEDLDVRPSVGPSGVGVQCVMAPWTQQREQSCYKLFYFIWRYRALLRSFALQGRCIGPETRALLAAILSCHGSLSISEENASRSFLLFFFDIIIAPRIVPDTEHRLK